VDDLELSARSLRSVEQFIRLETVNMLIKRSAIEELIDSHEEYRKRCVNLVASENALSPYVKRYLACDLVQRYGDYIGRDLGARKYQGIKWVEKVENEVITLAQEVFGTRYAELRAISGHIAGAAVIMALTKPGDTVLELGRDGGGHRMAAKLAMSPLISLDVKFLPFNPILYNVDVTGAVEMIERYRPRMVILGSSNFLFPHPVRELADALEQYPDTILAYDASHVFGLIAAGRFQDPLREGAQVVFGSTHKTLPGPQGGLILSNSEELMDSIAKALYPALVTNHHLARIPALGVCLLEMKNWGTSYADQIITNAQCLGEAVQAQGIDVVSANGRFSRSHTILLKVAPFGSGKEIASRLEEANIIVTAAHLPQALGTEGIRIGVQEITRLGAKEDDMEPLAKMIADVIMGRRAPHEIAPSAQEYANQFQAVKFTWET